MPDLRTTLLSGAHGDPSRTRRHDYGVVLLQLLWRLRLDLLLFAAVIGGILSRGPLSQWRLTSMGISVLGIAVSIFIAFRNTQAMGRWWEARTLLGALVNHSRQWRDGLLALLTPEQMASRSGRQLLEYQVVLVWLLNFELRNYWRADVRQGVDALLADLDLPSNLGLQVLCRQRAQAIREAFAHGWIDAWGRQQLIEINDRCQDDIGGLQRIRNTPIPASYDVFVRLITWVFGTQLMLEFYRDGQPLVGAVLFLGFLVAERIGSYVEGPFDRDGSSFSLPLNAICATITNDLIERPLPFGSFAPSHDPARWD